MFAACATFNDESIDRELKALTTVGNGEEYLGRVDSLVNAAGLSVLAHIEDLMTRGVIASDGPPSIEGRYRLLGA